MLRIWDHIDTASVVDLMERCLIERNKPGTIDDIFEYINKRRPVNAKSIKIYLNQRSDVFRRMSRTQWGLTSWNEAQQAKAWGPEQVADFVADIFKQHKTKELEFRILREALRDAAGVSDKQAQGLLNVNPVVKTRRESYNKIFAIFQPNYRTALTEVGARFERKKASLTDRFAEDVRETLSVIPGQEMPISDLVHRLMTSRKYKRATIYTYLNRIDLVEKFTVPGSRTVICRMKGQKSLVFPQIEEITDSNVRAEIKRAIQHLTLDSVDIGLFLLGRQFEVTIKRALLRGNQKGKITLAAGLSAEPSKWKLVQMVDCAKQCGLITDLGVANLLRQERNERAHGEPPSLDERQALVNSIQYLAGLYIDYILLFSKHEQGWT